MYYGYFVAPLQETIGMEENVIMGIYCVGNRKLLTDMVT